MSLPSKAWLIAVCLLSYFFMGQAGCQTTQSDITYVRSDIVRLRRDIEDIKKTVGASEPARYSDYQDLVRNQAEQREILLDLQDGQQRAESRIEETRYELTALRQEITNLKLNLISQMEALRATGKTAPVPQQYQPAPSARPAGTLQPPPATSAATPEPPATAPAEQPKPSPAPAPAPPRPAPVTQQAEPPKPIDYTKLYDTAYEDYVRQSYSLARSGFEEYLRRFPDTDLADNAQYWVGECYYAEGRYEEAAKAFKQVITRYPTGNKVPRAMLKAGYSLLQLNRTDEAKSMFQQVIDAYPLSSEADQAKAKLNKL